jgi:hypothetical protein
MGYLHTHAMHKPLYIPLALAVAALMLAAHLACSSTGGATYERGTPTRPPPAQTRPGVGLPVYDPQSKPFPPQPNPKPKRLLPPSREPGIWASDAPDDMPSEFVVPWGVFLMGPNQRIFR